MHLLLESRFPPSLQTQLPLAQGNRSDNLAFTDYPQQPQSSGPFWAGSLIILNVKPSTMSALLIDSSVEKYFCILTVYITLRAIHLISVLPFPYTKF